MLLGYCQQAAKTILASRLRAGLTVLSVTIGVLAIVLLTSLAQSGLSTFARGIEEIGGTRFICIWPDTPEKAARRASHYTRGITSDDIQALRADVPQIARISGFNQDGQVEVRRAGERERTTDLVSADDQFLDVWAYTLAAGRKLTAQDQAERARVVVVGADLADKLFAREEAVGQELWLRGDRYRVVGRLARSHKTNMSFGFDWNDMAIAPLSALHPDGRIGMAGMLSTDPALNGPLLDRANAILLHRHNQVDDFQFFDFAGVLKGFYAVFAGMILVVGLIAGMSLVIGGVGIMNIMLVSVMERRREIGLRKAIGASEGAIMLQFLVEATILSLAGALVGAVLGVAIAQAVVVLGPLVYPGWVGIVSPLPVAIAIAASIAIGLLAGWYPARQAAKLDPILCLRSE